MEWIRGKDIPSIYPIKRTYAYDLLQQFRAESDDWIKDGNVLIVKKESFEEWWKKHGQNKTNRRNKAG